MRLLITLDYEVSKIIAAQLEKVTLKLMFINNP